jgi:hypothetical protein
MTQLANSKHRAADVSIILHRESASSRKRRSIVGRTITNNWHRFVSGSLPPPLSLSLSLSVSRARAHDARNRPAVGVIDGPAWTIAAYLARNRERLNLPDLDERLCL